MEKQKRDHVTGVLLWTSAVLIGLLALGVIFILVNVASEIYHGWHCELWPYVVYVSVGAVPCLLALGAFCRLIVLIQADRSFSRESEKTVRFIAIMALIVCAYLVIGYAVMLMIGEGAAVLTVLLLFLVPAFLIIGFMALALSRLIHRAALLREENDLTV